MLVRNGLLNIAGQALPLLIGLATVPFVFHGLGTERFGLLVFSWTLTGAFNVFDLGLAGAVTKFVAEALGSGHPRTIPGIVWPAVVGQAVLGVTGAGILVAAAAPLVLHFLNVPPSIQMEAILTFRIVGLTLPVMLLVNSFRGALEAAQRFDIAAAVKSTSSVSVFLVPLVGVLARWDLPHIIGLLLVVRVFLLAVLVLSCIRILPALTRPFRMTREGLRRLFRFGGWITVSGLVGFVITYGDRFIIGNSLTMADVSYYTVPLEVISRLGLIAATLAAVLFPAFSTLGGAQNLPRLNLLFSRSIKYVVLTTLPAFGLLAVFAPDILRLWLGPTVAEHSAAVLRIVAVGAAFQVLAVIPTTVVQGLGRPDLTAKFHLLQAPVYLAVLWGLVQVGGIRGAALAWSGRIALEGMLLLWVTGRMGVWSWRSDRRAAVRVVIPVILVWVSLAIVYTLPVGMFEKAAVAGGLVAGFGWWAWTSALQSDERRWMLEFASGWKRHQ